MLIHGFGQTGRSEMNKVLKNSFLEHDDYNVIVVDWSKVGSSTYKAAQQNVVPIAKSVMQFIEWLKLEKGFIHIVGKYLTFVSLLIINLAFDLGCHIAGNAGKYMREGRIDKITGLDPARRGYNINQSILRLGAGDARFVEVRRFKFGRKEDFNQS